MAEPARVGEPELRAVVEHDPRPQVPGVGVRLVQARPAEPVGLHQVGDHVRPGLAQQQVAGHPQVHDQRGAVVEPHDQVLPAPPDRLDPAPGERLLDGRRRLGPRPALVEHLGALDRPPDDLGLELAADRLDLGKLGHAPIEAGGLASPRARREGGPTTHGGRPHGADFDRHLTYANVMVTLLAIGALSGGVAYAANTVGSSDIINESIQSVDLKNNQIQSVDVRNESLHSEDIGNLEIRSDNLGLNAVGPVHLASNTVSSAIYQRQGVTATDSTQTKELQVSCALGRPDDKVVSGGYVVANDRRLRSSKLRR